MTLFVCVLVFVLGACAPEKTYSYEPTKISSRRAVKEPLRVSFEEFDELFGLKSGKTELQKKDAFNRFKGQCVEWTGEMVYANEGLFGLSVGFKHLPGTFTYDTLVNVPSTSRGSVLKMYKGQRYQYKGTLKDYGGALLPTSLDWGCP